MLSYETQRYALIRRGAALNSTDRAGVASSTHNYGLPTQDLPFIQQDKLPFLSCCQY